MNRTSILMTFATLALFVCATARTSLGAIAYDNDTTAPNQFYGNSLGLDFNVNKDIYVGALGAYFGNTISNLAGVSPNELGVDVGIYQFDSNASTWSLVSPLVHFTPSVYDSTVKGDAFINIPTLHLSVGNYSVVAFNDTNYNSNGSPNGTSTTNDDGGAITFVGGGRYGVDTVNFPTIPDGGPTNRYDAGTFQYSTTPEPATLAIWGCGAFGFAVAAYRRRKLAV